MSNTKQHTEPFESCISQVMKQGHDKGSAFAICTDAFKKAGKPIFVGESEKQKLHLFCESFKLEGNRVSGVAIHPKRIFHPEEDMTHVYLRDELKNAAPTGAGKPFGIDHIYVLPQPNLLTKSWYCPDEDGICFEGFVDDYIAEQIRKKKFKGISIEINWLRPGGSVEYVNGVAPRNFELTSVHFLKQFPPGDADAFVKLWEQIKEQLVVGPPLPLDQRVETLEQQLHALLNQINVINGKLDVLTSTSSPSATAQPAQPGASQTIGGNMKMKEAEWDTEYVNNLPDSAFAYIESGGEKDEQGKTKPRSLRHFEYKNAEGNLDRKHIVNGLSRLGQDLGDWATDEAKAQIKKKLCAAVNAWNREHEDKIESEVCGTTAAIGESLKAKKLKEQVPWLTAEQQACIEDAIDAGKSGPEIAEECGIPMEAITGILMLKEQQGASPGKSAAKRAKQHYNISDEDWEKLSDEEKQAYIDNLPPPGTKLDKQGNQEPEKDEHGCLIGKERYDEEQDKCMPITAEARAAFLGAKLRLIEQEGDLTVDQIKAKIAKLAKQREELDKKLWPEPPESGLSEEEKAAIRTQIDVLWAEIDAYEQALKAKIAGQAVPPETPAGETELKEVKESIVALRKKLVAAEAMVLDIEKRRKREAATWKEKYASLREAVKGAIPPPRIWKSWTPGPQRYVQENLKILREAAS